MAFLSSIAKTVEVRSSTLGHLFRFLMKNKMWWMVPMISILVISFVLILIAQTSPLGPFIYTLF